MLKSGYDIGLTLDYDVVSTLEFNVGLTSDADVKPTLDCEEHNFSTTGVNEWKQSAKNARLISLLNYWSKLVETNVAMLFQKNVG